MKTISFFIAVTMFFSLSSFSQPSQFTLASLFTDNLVLQQKSDAPIWGKGKPGAIVSITPSWGKKVKSIVQPDSHWTMKLKTPKAGGPFTISFVHNGDTTKLNNVLIGEVWLCSGQSNMEMPLEGWPPENPIDNSAMEIQRAAFPKIRLFTVGHSISLEQNDTCVGTWKECTPKVASKFGATGFFFGKKLHQELNVPIGLIQSAWGGTPVQAWTSEKFITQHKNYLDFPSDLKQSREQFAAYMAWLYSHKVIDISSRAMGEQFKGLTFDDSVYARTDFNDSSWKEMNLPKGWEQTEVGEFDGVLWFRKQIEIPKHWLNKELVLEFGPIDDCDLAYINGKRIGGLDTGSPWNINRIYSVPAEIVNDSLLTIAVQVIDNGGGGGFWGHKEQLNIHPRQVESTIKDDSEKINLAGNWKYMPVAEYRDSKFCVFDVASREFYTRPRVLFEISSQTPTTLYNGMIAPLVPYAMKGAIWYQGESNTKDPEAYKTLFPLMIKNWRNDWQNDFSFYFVQIAPFNYSQGEQSQRLREAQLQTLSVPKTGMAVTLDIGNASNIHPSNKTDVGERLARWALAKDYAKKIPYSGPKYKSYKIKNNAMILLFEFADGLNIKMRNGKTYFEIAGEDSVFKEATVTVKGKTLLVRSTEVTKPIAVRYAWDDIAEAVLFNKTGLPASSFRTDNWKK